MSFLDNTDIQSFLNISTVTAEIALFASAACDVIENAVGPVTVREVTETIASRSGVIVLTHTPVVSVTSLAGLYVGALAWTPDQFTLDAGTGVLYQPFGRTVDGPYTVTYQAGRTVIPATITLAALYVLREIQRSQRGASPMSPGPDNSPAPQSYMEALTPRAAQLIAPYRRASALA